MEEAKNLELKLREDVTISWNDGLFTLSMGESGRGRKQRFAKVEELSDITIFSGYISHRYSLITGKRF